jgi:hypothetical protein
MHIPHFVQGVAGEVHLAAATAVGGTGYALSDDATQKTIIFCLTAVFLIAQIILLVPKYLAWYRDWRKRRNDAKWARIRAVQKRNREKSGE